ncbi:MAG: hypothetical protein ACRDTH_07115, partial [Pseudonocardiaceae bacterium]
MSTQPTETALSSHVAPPSSPNGEAITDVRLLGDNITAPRGKEPPSNGVTLMLGSNGNEPARKAETVTLVIPAKNEAANIAWVLEQVPACVDEIILVDGHSTDATLVTARSCRPDLR